MIVEKRVKANFCLKIFFAFYGIGISISILQENQPIMLSSKFNVYNSEWLDLVFANRNQSYGAYELRSNYNFRLNLALFVASALFVSVVCAPVIYRHIKGHDNLVKAASPTNTDEELFKITEYTPPARKEELPKPLAAAQGQSQPAKVKTIVFVKPRVVPVDLVEREIPTMVEIETSVISNITQEGVSGFSNASANSTEGEGRNGSGTFENGTEEVMSTGSIEHQPEFPGGYEAFAKYLRKNLHYPSSASENGVSGRVYINFIVEKDGRLTDITVVKGIGFGCDEEAVRVLKKSPMWQPGQQNGRKVRVMFTIPIVFSMGE